MNGIDWVPVLVGCLIASACALVVIELVLARQSRLRRRRLESRLDELNDSN